MKQRRVTPKRLLTPLGLRCSGSCWRKDNEQVRRMIKSFVGGLTATEQIKAVFPVARIIVVSQWDNPACFVVTRLQGVKSVPSRPNVGEGLGALRVGVRGTEVYRVLPTDKDRSVAVQLVTSRLSHSRVLLGWQPWNKEDCHDTKGIQTRWHVPRCDRPDP